MGPGAKSYMRKGFVIMRKCTNLSPYTSRPLLIYTVKKRIGSFPSPAGMSLPNSPWAGIMTS